MEQILTIMLPLAPVGMALMACVAFGLALSAREALGRERGLRHAAEKARDATLKTLTTYKDWDLAELGRYRRLLDCHVDALIAEATEFRDRPVPSPGRILEGLCSWNASWRRDLARCAELKPADVERLLKDELPITPLLARRLEAFTGAPARFWENVYRLIEYRAETEQTAVMRLGDALQLRERSAGVPASTAGSTPAAAPRSQGAAPAAGRRPRLEIVADGPPTQGPAPVLSAAPSAAAGQPASSGPSSSAPRTTTSKPPAPPPVRRSAAELPSPVVPHPGLVAREPRGALPPPPRPRLRPASSPTGIAATLTDFPIQREGAPATGSDDIESSPFNSTLPGVGSGETSA